jgi:hypothetical protein
MRPTDARCAGLGLAALDADADRSIAETSRCGGHAIVIHDASGRNGPGECAAGAIQTHEGFGT